MNPSVSPSPIDLLRSAPPVAEVREKDSLGADLAELTKGRLTFMVLLTALAGYCFANQGPFNWARLFHTMLGTALVAVCSSILNQALERKTDALMRRTQMRPFVTGRLPVAPTVFVGLGIGALGLAELAFFVNGLTALLSALTLLIYVFVYTPLKSRTELNTFVGTLPGALPPLLGATAARGHFSMEGWALFALLAVWQLPHFYAIAWMYRDDYRSAGLCMVSTRDSTGRRTSLHALVSALVLLPVSLLPVAIGRAGMIYGTVAVLFSAAFIFAAWRFVQQSDRARARALFFVSIIYLPVVLIALAADAWLAPL